ncbi:MAG: extracellular solute-binding protein [Phycisphaerales bacterium]|nr:extracellular solute-binding protein [Phycisphaerales bacterium]
MRESSGRFIGLVFLGGIALAALGYAIFGPKPATAVSGDRIVLNYWEKWTGSEAAAMQQVVDAFNASQDRVHVNYLTMSSIDEKAMLSIAGGAPPDVLGLWSFNLPFYAQADAILPLDLQGIVAETYAPAVRPLVFDGDQQLAGVNTCSSVAVYVNLTHLDRAGLDWRNGGPPRTLEQFDAMIPHLTIHDEEGNVEQAAFLHMDPGWWHWCWPGYFGGQLYDVETDTATIDSPENIAAFTWFQEGQRRYGRDALRRFQSAPTDNPSPYRNFLTGRLSMTIQGPWMARVIAESAPELNWAAWPLPGPVGSPDAPAGPIECDILVVPRGAPHPDEAMEFIAFTQRQDMVELVSSLHAKPSPLMDVSADFYFNHLNTSIAAHEAILHSPNGFGTPPVATWPEMNAALTAGVDRIWNGDEDVATALSEVQAEVEGQLERARIRRQRRGQERFGARP